MKIANQHSYTTGLRMAKIVQMLYTEKHPIYLHDLAGLFAIHPKMVERYVRFIREFLVVSGEPLIHDDRDEKGRRIFLKNGLTKMDPTAFQVASAYMGLQMMAFLKDSQIPEGLSDVIAVLKSKQKNSAKDLTGSFDRKFFAINIGQKDYSDKEKLISDILVSLIKETQVSFTYKARKHQVKPYTLLTFRAGLYLVGFTATYKEMRMFAMDRISDLVKLKEKFAYPVDYSPEKYFKDSFGITSGVAEKVLLKFNKKRAPYIKERTWHRTAKFEETNGALLLSMECPVSPELKQWILSNGGDVEVVAPKSLRKQITEEAKAILKANNSSGSSFSRTVILKSRKGRQIL